MSSINRKKTTEYLSKLLISRMNDNGVYYSSEVTLDFGTAHPKRVDYVSFEPLNQRSVAGLEKGTFTCYEIKSCIEDLKSGNGLNFFGDYNYIVTTMATWNKLVADLHATVTPTGKKSRKYQYIDSKLLQNYPEDFKNNFQNIGFMVFVPYNKTMGEEFDNPTEDITDVSGTLQIIASCYITPRTRSITELLFCMLRSGK